MIVVKVEIWPFGEESEAKEIGRMKIANDGTGSLGLGNYFFTINPQTDNEVRGEVRNHQRQRGVWVLLQKCLSSVKEDL